ncbi:hypothetical protein EAF00_005938 [Botryotinia globosa]|nr:hypothetical protein EAF00_005938 [Botryotinia globosa]
MALAPLRIVEDPASFLHSTSRPYLYYVEGKEYTGLDSRIISTRSRGLEKLGDSILKTVRKGHNIEEESLALQTKRYRSLRSYFYKKLLKVYHEEMGDAATMPLPDEDDKNRTTKQHYTGLDKMSQVNHIQDSNHSSASNGRKGGYTKTTLQANIRVRVRMRAR